MKLNRATVGALIVIGAATSSYGAIALIDHTLESRHGAAPADDNGRTQPPTVEDVTAEMQQSGSPTPTTS